MEQRALAETHLQLIDTLTPQIKELDARIKKQSQEHPGAVLLQTIPGIVPYRSLLLVGEVLPISRFSSPAHLVSYAGLAPRTRSSGGKTRYGSTPQEANRWVRGVLVSAIPSHMRSTPESSLGTYYERQKDRGGRRPVWPPPENSAGLSTPCSPRGKYGAAESGSHPADRGELVPNHAASTAFTPLTGPPRLNP